jgi:hypothetical protein
MTVVSGRSATMAWVAATSSSTGIRRSMTTDRKGVFPEATFY